MSQTREESEVWRHANVAATRIHHLAAARSFAKASFEAGPLDFARLAIAPLGPMPAGTLLPRTRGTREKKDGAHRCNFAGESNWRCSGEALAVKNDIQNTRIYAKTLVQSGTNRLLCKRTPNAFVSFEQAAIVTFGYDRVLTHFSKVGHKRGSE